MAAQARSLVAKKALLALLSSSLLLLAAEALARRYFHEPDLGPPPPSKISPYAQNPFLVRARPFLHFHLPNARYIQAAADYEVEYRINSLGFRGAEYAERSVPGQNRLLVIGDSHVEGHGVGIERTFPSLLDRGLRARGWQAVNVGVQGASPIYYASNLARYLNLNPDAVLIALFHNDISDDRIYEHSLFSLPYLQRPSALLEPTSDAVCLGSRLCFLLNGIADRASWSYRSQRLSALVKRNLELSPVRPEGYLELLERHVENPALFARHWALTSTYLDEVVRVFRQEGVRVLVVTLARMRSGLPRDEMFDRYSRLYGEKVHDWATSRNLPIFDFNRLVQRHKAGREPIRLTFPSDGHPSRVGHEFLAEHLEPWLVAELE